MMQRGLLFLDQDDSWRVDSFETVFCMRCARASIGRTGLSPRELIYVNMQLVTPGAPNRAGLPSAERFPLLCVPWSFEPPCDLVQCLPTAVPVSPEHGR